MKTMIVAALMAASFAGADEASPSAVDGNPSFEGSATNLGCCLTSNFLESLQTSNATQVVVGGILHDGEVIQINGMEIKAEKKAFGIHRVAGGADGFKPLKWLEGRRYLLRMPEPRADVFLWTEFDKCP